MDTDLIEDLDFDLETDLDLDLDFDLAVLMLCDRDGECDGDRGERDRDALSVVKGLDFLFFLAVLDFSDSIVLRLTGFGWFPVSFDSVSHSFFTDFEAAAAAAAIS